ALSGTLRNHVFNKNTIFSAQTETRCQSGRDIAGRHTNSVMVNVPFISHLVIDASYYIAGNSEADSFVTARLRKNERVYADHVSGSVYQRSPTAARVNGRVGLNIDRRTLWI